MLGELVLVAVVGLVVKDDDPALAAAQVPQYPGRDLLGGLAEGVGRLTLVAAQELPGVGRNTLDLLRITRQEGVVVDDLDLGMQECLPEVRRYKVALAV